MYSVNFLTTGLAFAGAETQLVALATGLAARGLKVSVTSMVPPKAFVALLNDHDIAVDTLGMTPGVPTGTAVWRYATILRRRRPDVTHSHMVHANLLARVVRPFYRKGILVCTAHNINEGGRVREFAYRITDPLCDVTTNVSRAGVQRYVHIKAIPRAKALYVPNGIDLGRFAKSDTTRRAIREEFGLDSQFVWLNVARFDHVKDHATLIRAFAETVRSVPASHLLLAGDGPMKGATEALAGELGIARSVTFLGVRSDVPKLMQAADGFVMSSRWEGLPMVLLEACAAELPIVATDVGGVSEIIQAGMGFLASPGDVRQIARHMLHVVGMPSEDREQIARSARAHVEMEYDINTVLDRWVALYTDYLHRASR